MKITDSIKRNGFHDLLASMVVFLVALPLCMGIAIALAAIASAESLLCATAVDRMHTGSRTDYNRELITQGFGNTVCGLFGALPMTGVIVRSTVNVSAGARTRLSAILHGVWLLILVATAPFVLQLIPIASLAALLVFTGYKLMTQDLRSLQRAGSSEQTPVPQWYALISSTKRRRLNQRAFRTSLKDRGYKT